MTENKKIKVALGMSGGVDSSVAALLLKEQGFDVVGLFMKLWNDPTCSTSRENSCCDEKAQMDAKMVADRLGIPFYVVDAREYFKQEVTDYYLDEYKHFRTPNPCAICNKKIKFGWMLDFAKKIGCNKVATGHYCQIEEANGALHLKKGADEKKDQTYFLYQLDQDQLGQIIFPVGHLAKDKVRELAKKADLPVFEKAESQEVCFIHDKSYTEFLKRYLPEDYFKSGRIVDLDGYTVGKHKGLVNYTVGQRKGIDQTGIFNNGKDPIYVTGFDKEKNELIVGKNTDTFKSEMTIDNLTWIDPKTILSDLKSTDLAVKIRYGASAVACEVADMKKDQITLKFAEPQRAVTPGQCAVFYIHDQVLGGGTILR
ncbi:MAG: tRNA 2-thiouridine(34) synthase MnmA [Candidatus Berkelbacteria bacterium]